jgi:WD40 repeat protein
MKKVCLSLLLMAGANIFASGGDDEGSKGDKGRADRYYSTRAGAGVEAGHVYFPPESYEANEAGGGGGKDACGGVEFEDCHHGATILSKSLTPGEMADESTDSVSGRIDPIANKFTVKDKVFNDSDLVDNIVNFLTIGEIIGELSFVSKIFNQVGERRWRFVHAARVAQPIALDAQAGPVKAVLGLSDGRIAAGYENGIIRLWNSGVSANNPVVELRGHTAPISGLVELSDGHILSSAYSHDNVVKVWNLTNVTHQKPWTVRELDNVIGAVLLSDKRVVLGSTTMRLLTGAILWDPSVPHANSIEFQTSTRYSVLEQVQCLQALPEGDRFIVGFFNGAIKIFDLAVREPVLLGYCESRVNSLVALNAGLVVSGSEDGKIKIWNLTTPGADSLLLGCCKSPVISLVTLNGGRVASGSEDGKVQIWNPKIPDSESMLLRQHNGAISYLALLRDGRIVSGSEDGIVKFQQSVRCFIDKVQRTQQRIDYDVDGVYDILFPHLAQAHKTAAEGVVDSFSDGGCESGGGGGSKDDAETGGGGGSK